MIVRGGEVNPHARAGVEPLQGAERGLDAGAKEGEAVGLGEDEVRGEQRNAARERLAEEAVGLDMVLVAPAAQRDPRAAIDEQSGGRGDALES
jgi:hypothetical protein